MKRKLTGVIGLILCMALVFSACGGGEPDPHGQSGSSIPSEKKELSAKYDDSLIEEYLTEEGTYKNEWQETDYSYHLPRLLDNTADARSINRDIENNIEPTVRAAIEGIEKDEGLGYISVTWDSFWNGSVLSLVIEEVSDFEFTDYSVYNYDFKKGRALDNSDLIEYAGLDEEAFYDALRRAAAQEFDKNNIAMAGDYYLGLLYLRAETISYSNIENAKLFMDEKGNVSAITYISVPAGGGIYTKTLHPDISASGEEKTFEYGFVSAKLKNNGVTVVFSEKDDWQNYMGGALECGREYKVEGLYGNYTDIFIGTMGQDFYPVLFLTDTEGYITFCELMGASADTGRFIAAGPLPWVENVVSYEEDTAGDEYYSYVTVFANTKSGEHIDLYDTVYRANGLVISELQDSTWVTNDGDWGVEYVPSKESPFSVMDFAGGDTYAPYMGWMTYTGMTEQGIHYSFNCMETNAGAAGPESLFGSSWWSGMATYECISNMYRHEDDNELIMLVTRKDADRDILNVPLGESTRMVRSWG